MPCPCVCVCVWWGGERERTWCFGDIPATTSSSYTFSSSLLLLRCDVQAIEMLDEWTPIDTADALELLSKNYTADGVRQYAVRQVSMVCVCLCVCARAVCAGERVYACVYMFVLYMYVRICVSVG